jgi:hypothetical protein
MKAAAGCVAVKAAPRRSLGDIFSGNVAAYENCWQLSASAARQEKREVSGAAECCR